MSNFNSSFCSPVFWPRENHKRKPPLLLRVSEDTEVSSEERATWISLDASNADREVILAGWSRAVQRREQVSSSTSVITRAYDTRFGIQVSGGSFLCTNSCYLVLNCVLLNLDGSG